ncbi:MAG: sugar phosphate isomerase/epimerase [Lachnospiraceae bacterium]|nr:sugar phosphate isomerase/epimerase [Lachnospiraceae bacterium]
MRLGLSSPLRHGSPEQWAERMAELGTGTVVFPVDCTATDAVIGAYERAARANGLTIAEVGVWRNTLAADPAEREKQIGYAAEQLMLADAIGARCCVNVVGTPCGPRWDGGYRGNFSEEVWQQAVEMIREVIDRAQPKRTKYSIEPMPWMIPTGPEEYCKLLQDVDREAFGVHLDVVNMITSPERYFFNDAFLRECFEKLGGRICSCHIKDVHLAEEFTFRLEEVACGKGALDLELYAELATREDPDMPMIIEHLHTDEEYLESLAYVKNRLGSYLR